MVRRGVGLEGSGRCGSRRGGAGSCGVGIAGRNWKMRW